MLFVDTTVTTAVALLGKSKAIYFKKLSKYRMTKEFSLYFRQGKALNPIFKLRVSPGGEECNRINPLFNVIKFRIFCLLAGVVQAHLQQPSPT